MERRRLTLSQAALIGWAAVSASAFALAVGLWPLFLVIPVMAFSGFRPISRVPPSLGLAFRWPSGLLTGAVALLPLLVTFQGMALEQAVSIAKFGGILLCVIAAFSLFTLAVWPAGSIVIPASLALLAAAGLRRDTPFLTELFAIAGVLAAIHLAASRRIRLLPLAAFAGVTAGVATALCLLLPWAQPLVEAKAGDLLISGGTARAGLSLTSRLGDIEELALSPTIVMRVWTSRPQYLRARVYTRFDGRSWFTSSRGARISLGTAPPLDSDLAAWLEQVPGATLAVPDSSALPPQIRTRILQEPSTLRVLPAPGEIVLARAEGGAAIDDAGVLQPSGPPPELYAVVNRRDGDVAQSARAPGEDCLDTGKVSDPRLRELADRLRDGADPAERVRRTAAYLETNCTYSLKVGAFRSADPVGEFVFDKRRGYCEYFASAAALLLRLQDVPARYVVGYSVRPSNLEGGHYVVRAADAHAWVEAFLPGRGWVEVDPTPAAQFEEMRAPIRGGLWASGWERIKSWMAELIALIRQGGVLIALRRGWLPILGAALAIGLALWSFRVGGRRLRSFLAGRRRKEDVAIDADPVPAELQELMRRLDALWKKSGHPRPASRAPLEHLRGLPAAAQVGGDLVDEFYRCRYGGSAPSPEAIAGLQKTLTALRK